MADSTATTFDKIGLVVHTVAVAEPRDFPRRVFIEDVRRDGMFLRVTWHAEHAAFVVSHWDRDVCVAATRVAARDVPDLVSLLANGLADGLVAAATEPVVPTAPPQGPRWRRWPRMLSAMLRRRAGAEIISFPERDRVTSADDVQWKRQNG